jgi:DNA polymerase I-like protein with 3'-5' exonuclease and polymerase domains
MNRTAQEVDGYPWVVLVGSVATNAFFSKTRTKNLRGNVAYHPDYPGQRFYAIYHPAWVFHKGKNSYRIFDEMIARLARAYRGDEPEMDILRSTSSGYLDKIDDALESRRISFDIETDRLESWMTGSTIRSLAFTHDGETVFFAHHDEPSFGNVMDRVGEFLKDPKKQVIGHHIGFDLDWMEQKLGITVQAKPLDTGTLWYHAKDYRMPSLKYLVSEQLDGYRHLVTNPDEEDNTDLLGKYNAEDVIYPWRLFKRGVEMLNKDQLDLYLRVSSPSDLYLQRITSTGIYFDVDKQHKVEQSLWEERNDVVKSWAAEDDDLEVYENQDGNLTVAPLEGDKALREYLFKVKDLPIISRTDKANLPQTDKDVIRSLREDYGAEYLRHKLEISRIDKLLSTYVEGMQKNVGSDGRIHADYLNTWTDSGRWSSRNPNMQNIPRDKRVRSFFAASPGYIFVDADYSQIELRVMLSLAGQQDAIQAYREGQDIHAQTAMEISGKDTFTKEERTMAKPINFGLVYGGSYFTLQQQARSYGIKLTDDEAKKYHKLFFDKYDRLPAYHDEVIQRLRDNKGWVQDIVGHVHHYDGWNDENMGKREHAERAAINSMGQGPASYMTAYTGIIAQQIIRRRGLNPQIRMVNTVHDSVSYEAKEGYVEDLKEILTEANERTAEWVDSWFHTPLVLEFEVGESWGEKEELDYKAVA